MRSFDPLGIIRLLRDIHNTVHVWSDRFTNHICMTVGKESTIVYGEQSFENKNHIRGVRFIESYNPDGVVCLLGPSQAVFFKNAKVKTLHIVVDRLPDICSKAGMPVGNPMSVSIDELRFAYSYHVAVEKTGVKVYEDPNNLQVVVQYKNGDKLPFDSYEEAIKALMLTAATSEKLGL